MIRIVIQTFLYSKYKIGVMLISFFIQKTWAFYFFPCISIPYQLSLVGLASLLGEDLERYVLMKKIIVHEREGYSFLMGW